MAPVVKSLAEKMGLRGEWYRLFGFWNGTEYTYLGTTDGNVWAPYTDDGNVVSIRYHGGPKDGKVEA